MDTSEQSEIDTVIGRCDAAFAEPVTQRTIYSKLLEKLHQKGQFIFAYNGESLGYCAFYANDSEQKNGYISLIAISPECQKMRIGTKLLQESLAIMQIYGMDYCLLEVRKNNQTAIRFYEANHFRIAEERNNSY